MCVKDISIFAPLHVIADVFILVSLAAIEVFMIIRIVDSGVAPSVRPATSIFSAAQTIGIATGAFECVATIISIYKQAAIKSLFIRLQSIALACITILYVSLGLFGYLAYGVDVKGPVTLSLEQGSVAVELIQAIYILALIPTTLIQIYPLIHIVELYIAKPIQTPCARNTVRYILRAGLMIAMIWVAVFFGERYDKVLSLVGNLAVSPLSYLLPGIIHLVLVAHTTLDKLRDIVLIVFGSACFILATTLQIIGWAT